MTVKPRRKNRERRGAPWTEEEEQRLLSIAHLPPWAIADVMQRSWLACRRRLSYLRANGDRTAEYQSRAGVSRWPNRRSPASTQTAQATRRS
jgi:hypothetical protein